MAATARRRWSGGSPVRATESIARAGGGILSTAAATAALSETELAAGALPRVDALLLDGVTTLEIKSGYGLELEVELRSLRAARQLGALRAAFGQHQPTWPRTWCRASFRAAAMATSSASVSISAGGSRKSPGGCGGRLLREHRVLGRPGGAGIRLRAQP